MTEELSSGDTIVEKLRSGGIRKIRVGEVLLCLFALALSGFSLYTGFTGLLESWLHRMIHLVCILMIAFLTDLNMPQAGKIKKVISVLFLILVAAIALYSFLDYEHIILRMGRPNHGDIVIGILLVLVTLMASKRKLGWAVTIIAACFLFYAFFGFLFPSSLYHRGMSISRFVDFIYNQTKGILGIPIKVAAEYVIMFILFAAFLNKSGAGNFFIDLAFGLTGKMWGGPAKAAVVASAMMATINGSGVGNAVATGSITIPLMKRVGYKPHFAAAIEAAASNGGMITPPIMASVAFLIAEFTNTPYSKIMLVGIFPAFLYFSAVLAMVHFEAKRLGLGPMRDEDIPSKREVLKKGWYYLLPIIILAAMLIMGYSPMLAASVGIVAMVLLSFIRKETRMGIWDILAAMEEGAKNTVMVSVACAVAGIVVGVITGTGLGIKFSSMILAVSRNSLFVVLLLTMVSSIVLGMGMTAAAVYVIVSALTVPALLDMGVAVLPAHFFVYYYGIASALTPPVALAAYGAAGIAGADHNKTALTACRLAIVAFLVPFAFVYNPALMAIGTPLSIVLSVGSAFFGVLFLSAGFSRFLFMKLDRIAQLLLLVGGLGLLSHLILVNVISLAVCLFIAVYLFRTSKRKGVVAA
ncbi:TRAP transporter permease [Sediminispirochaeta bajacaliforniensis]|uniref:TRAP transporter permease n=1 Tax=Sediminispirochaeta bajacaliforniensis TaxID=148 RepID=UPI00037B69B9|nr:TRAP transporter fused permease subunit [Sediminispirochaeta bajacaliforniensis]